MNDINLIKEVIKELRFSFPYSAEEYSENLFFENYHCHKDFSNTTIADSAESIEDYALKTKEYKGKCLFSGEHGNQGNQFLTYKVAEKEELKYRHSVEAYWVKDRHEKDRKNCHIMLIAKNPRGRKDINYILSIANEDGFYGRPRIDLELLLNIPKDNIIVTSACVAGWNYDDGDEIWLKIAEHFGDNFFLEVQNHNTKKQKDLNQHIIELANKHNLQIVCGLDSHYISDETKIKRDMILKYKKISYPEEDGWYMDYPDAKTIIQRFREQGILNDKQIYTALMNTNIFVLECQDIILDKSFKIPSKAYPNTTYEQRVQIYKNILNEAYSKEKFKSSEKLKGIQYEANEVIQAEVVDYFLFNQKLVKIAVEKNGGILTTTSRGSSASFITNKLLGFTTIDRFNAEIPIYPERFLTKERVLSGQMPDIDWNVAKQAPFVEAARELVGEHGCYPLMAVEKLKVKAAWQLYAGANDVEPSIANDISKCIEEYEKAVKYAEEDQKDFIDPKDFIPAKYMDIYIQSLEYQQITINLKVHACGYLIFDGDIREEIGLISAVSKTTGKRTICACIEGGYLDEFGYVKDDFLIVDSVGLTNKFFKSIGESVPSFEELREMIADDQLTWDIYKKGITCCVNQCEKESTTKKMMIYQAKNLAELAAFIAGIRPGFKSLITTFINRKEYTTGETKIDELLNETAHFMLYQESIMKVLSFLKVTMTDTYGIIKSISKKKLKGEKKKKLEDNLNNSWFDIFSNRDNFKNVWKVIEDSSLYAFNSPHAWSMGGDSAYQAWFKAHYTSKFYEVAINHYQEKGDKDKIDALVKEIIKFFNYKMGDYAFGKDNRKVVVDEKEKTIYPNLSSIKGIGESVSCILYDISKLDNKDFFDVLRNIGSKINKPIIEMLIKIGYFGCFGEENYLLHLFKYFNLLNGKKEISKEKCKEYGIPLDIANPYGKETNKKITQLKTDLLLADLLNISVEPLPILEKVRSEFETLGLIRKEYPNLNKNYILVTQVDTKYSPKYI